MDVTKSEYGRWRKKIFGYTRFFIIITAILEILCFVLYLITDREMNSIFSYVIKNIVLPIIINVGTYIICNMISKRYKDENTKNTACIYSLIVPCTVIVIVHSLYPQIAMSFSLILAVCSMFGEKKLLKYVLYHGIMAIILAFIIELFKGRASSSSELIVGVIITLMLFICTYLSCRILLENNIEKMNKITKYRSEQDEFLELLKYDSLTGLYNNNAIKTTIAFDLRYKDLSNNYFLAMIDIDDFKLINDNHGHVFGDMVLSKISNIIGSEQSDNVIAARYGGEEFAMSFYDMNKEDVLVIIKRILKRFSEYFNEYNLTFSCGVALANKDDYVDSLIDRADLLLYDVKKTGKNNIKFE